MGLFNVDHLITTYGTIGIIAIIFIESSFFPFLPGDSLLFAAGLFVVNGRLNLAVVLIGCLIAATIGNQVGYLLGQQIGPKLFQKPNARFFKPIYFQKSHEFFERHGVPAIVLARFVPIVRTFTAFVAGVAKMRYRTFVTFNFLGALLWTGGLITAGWLLGKRFPKLANHLELVAIVIILISLIPLVFEWWKHRKSLTPNT